MKSERIDFFAYEVFKAQEGKNWCFIVNTCKPSSRMDGSVFTGVFPIA